jgi:hypothetical protein
VHANNRFSGSGVVSYPVILVNTPGVWDSIGQRVVITVNGTYFIEIVAEIDADTPGTMNVTLLRNSAQVLSRLAFGNPSYFVTRCNTALVDLVSGDTLSVTYTNSQIGGGQMMGLSFQGLMLYPT